VLTLSGLRAPIPLVRNKVAIIYAYGNFLTKYICYYRENTIYLQKLNIMKEKYRDTPQWDMIFAFVAEMLEIHTEVKHKKDKE
jgi:hypothetical protein